MPANQIRAGQRIPNVPLATLDAFGQIQVHDSDMLFHGDKVLVVGVPGSFTPVCTAKHLPPIIKNADRLKQAGFTDLFCIATSDPFSVDAWARQVDPERELRFISDGNLDFARACGLLTHEQSFFLGHRSRRYSMVLKDSFVAQVNVEASVLDVTCSAAEALLDA